MNQLLMENARVLTLDIGTEARTPRRGSELKNLGVIERGWVRVQDGLIDAVGAENALRRADPNEDWYASHMRGVILFP